MNQHGACKLCGEFFTDIVQLLRAAAVVEHYESSHPGVNPGSNPKNNPGMNAVMVS